jgi:pimeloyl-ACP methyl ester carboxylesterase
MSQGSIAALAFGARHPGLARNIALAQRGHRSRPVTVFPRIAQSVTRAKAMVVAGRGDERVSFNDQNVRGPFKSIQTAPIYLSFFYPSGPANMLDKTSRLHEPLLWIAGAADRSQPGPGYAFSHVPANPSNRYVTVSADHLGTPTAARETAVAGLRELH